MLTDRDAEIVEWNGQLGAAGAEHTMYRYAMSRSVAYERLGTLVRDGLLERHAILYARPGMYVATSAGLRWRGNERLGRYSLFPSGFEHAWQLARVAVEIEVMGDWDLLSEREIRAAETDAGQAFASAQIGMLADRPALHRPDLALTTSTGRVACIEVELSIKSASRLAAICRGWATRAAHRARLLPRRPRPRARRRACGALNPQRQPNQRPRARRNRRHCRRDGKPS